MNGFSEYPQYDAVGLAELVDSGEVDAAELLDTAIRSVESLNPQLNAVVTTMFEEARGAIDAGLPPGPLGGVPFLLKDLSADFTGVPTRRGSRAFREYIPQRDTELVARYRRGGLVIIGKTNTPELGINVSTEPMLYGPARNPWNLQHSTGGSSGGSAAAVAARLVPVAHATDGGGSIRIPASCCGVFGLKPTRGRVSHAPSVGEGWAGMSTGHVVSRSVRDSAALLDVVAGPASGDPYWAQPPSQLFSQAVNRTPGGLRIALSLTPPTGAEVDPQCIAAARDAGALCEGLGHTIEEASPPVSGDELRHCTGVIIRTKIAEQLDKRAAELGRPLIEDDLERATFWLYEQGRTVTGVEYSHAVEMMHRIGRHVARFMETYDMILSPVLADPPFPLGKLDMMADEPRGYFDTLNRYAPFTNLYNVTGQPAMSVPLYWSDDGLPIGVQFAGRYGNEEDLFSLAAQLEQERPWAMRRPGTSA